MRNYFTLLFLIGTTASMAQSPIGSGTPVSGDLYHLGGKLGIGTDNPQFGKLQVNQSSDASDQGIAVLNSTGQRAMRLWTDANNSYIYSAGTGSSKLILNTSGYVGIGTDSPINKLHVSNDDGTDTKITVGTFVGGTEMTGSIGIDANDVLYLMNGNQKRLRINSDGNVGIGVDPTMKLDVNGNIRLRGDNGKLIFRRNTSAADIAELQYDHANSLFVIGANNKDIVFRSQLNFVETARITADGKVGIGTANPDQKLDVWGDIGWGTTGASLMSNQGASIKMRGNGTPFLDFVNDPTTDYDARLILINDDNLQLKGAQLEIINQGDGKEVLKLSIERPWAFKQQDSVGQTSLVLQSLVNGDKKFRIKGANNNEAFNIGSESGNSYFSGNMGIGTSSTFGYKLAVNGTIGAKEVVVEVTSAWPDYVFSPDYNLTDLSDLETYLNENHHLPGIPSAQEVENGIAVGEMNRLLLEKVEELTLYILQQEERIKKLESDK